MFEGLRTVIYHVEDLKRAKEWYSKALGTKPYFDEPFYVGFNVGGFELGLDPDMSHSGGDGKGVAYWGVPRIAEAVQRLTKLGGRVVEDVREVGEGIKVASVRDPFGNTLGIIENPNFRLPPSP